ncbi:unnamed protein product [Caenorhabditis brenneri]
MKLKLREYMILDAAVLIILVVLLINSFRSSYQHQETQAMISNLQSQFNSFQKHTTGSSSPVPMNEKEETIEMENEKMKEMLEEVLKEVKTKTTVAVETTMPPTVFIPENNSEVNYSLPESSIRKNATLVMFNAASLIEGATVDTYKSSSSTLNPYFRFDQSSLVLVDRPEPPIGKEWCTYEKEPVLTVSLAKYVKPTAVSYQHSKWNGTVPDDAPKVYDVVACLDFYCEKWEPLASNCSYSSNGYGEQFCNVRPNSMNPIGKVQFRFRKNYGNTERTCVSLIRVYAETEEVRKSTLRSLEDTKTCLDLKHDYHNKPFTYNNFDFKNCTVLYSAKCCEDCPECCEECDIQDVNGNVVTVIFVIILFSPIWGYILVLVLIGIGFVIYGIVYGLYLLFKKCVTPS